VVLAWDGNVLSGQDEIAAGAGYELAADDPAYWVPTAVAVALAVAAPAVVVVVRPRKRAARIAARAVADLVKLDEVRMMQGFPTLGNRAHPSCE
jgi:hypothetical protein